MLVIDVTGPGGKVDGIVALIDSGASTSLFPVGMMGAFGIAKADCTELQGLTANGPCKQWRWDKGHLTTTVDGKHVNLVAMFGPTDQVLLGREDFFRAFKIAFDQRKQRFRLDPY